MITHRTTLMMLWLAGMALSACGEEASGILDAIVQDIKDGSMSSLEIYSLPREVSVIIPVSPEALMKTYSYKVECQSVGRNNRIAEMVRGLLPAPQPPNPEKQIDFRMAIFFKKQDEVVAKVFLDGFLKVGDVNGCPVVASDAFRKHLKAIIEGIY